MTLDNRRRLATHFEKLKVKGEISVNPYAKDLIVVDQNDEDFSKLTKKKLEERADELGLDRSDCVTKDDLIVLLENYTDSIKGVV